MDSYWVKWASSTEVRCSAVLEPAVSAAASAAALPAALATALASAPVAWATEATGSVVGTVVMALMALGLTRTKLPSLDTKAS